MTLLAINVSNEMVGTILTVVVGAIVTILSLLLKSLFSKINNIEISVDGAKTETDKKIKSLEETVVELKAKNMAQSDVIISMRPVATSEIDPVPVEIVSPDPVSVKIHDEKMPKK